MNMTKNEMNPRIFNFPQNGLTLRSKWQSIEPFQDNYTERCKRRGIEPQAINFKENYFVLIILFIITLINNISFSQQIEIENSVKVISEINPKTYNMIISKNETITNTLIIPNITTLWRYRSINNSIFEENFSGLKLRNGNLYWISIINSSINLNNDSIDKNNSKYDFFLAKTNNNSNNYKINYTSPNPIKTLKTMPNAIDCVFNIDILNKYNIKENYNKIFYDFIIKNESEFFLIISIKEAIKLNNGTLIDKGTELWNYKKEINSYNDVYNSLNYNEKEWVLLKKIDFIFQTKFKIIENDSTLYILDKNGFLYTTDIEFKTIKLINKINDDINNLIIVNDLNENTFLILKKDNSILFSSKKITNIYILSIIETLNNLIIDLNKLSNEYSGISKNENEKYTEHKQIIENENEKKIKEEQLIMERSRKQRDDIVNKFYNN